MPTYWIKCPSCGNPHFIKARKDTVLIRYPGYCKHCKKEIVVTLEPKSQVVNS